MAMLSSSYVYCVYLNPVSLVPYSNCSYFRLTFAFRSDLIVQAFRKKPGERETFFHSWGLRAYNSPSIAVMILPNWFYQ